jgi:hypothetical protein
MGDPHGRPASRPWPGGTRQRGRRDCRPAVSVASPPSLRPLPSPWLGMRHEQPGRTAEARTSYPPSYLRRKLRLAPPLFIAEAHSLRNDRGRAVSRCCISIRTYYILCKHYISMWDTGDARTGAERFSCRILDMSFREDPFSAARAYRQPFVEVVQMGHVCTVLSLVRY